MTPWSRPPPEAMTQLTFTEEIVLLALDDKSGAQLQLPVTALGYGLAEFFPAGSQGKCGDRN